MKILAYKKIVLGELTANQLTLFESKKTFSVIFYFFKGDGWQDRFHTHAFNAWSLRLFGTYKYRELRDNQIVECERRELIKFFPRSTNHMLGPSTGCLTLLFSGPWEPTWQETKDGRTRTLAWGRKRIDNS